MSTSYLVRQSDNRIIDLRSDANTMPTVAMRDAMYDASVGDDQYGEDPSVNALEARVAEMLGKDAAMFVASGTMANQIALRVLTRPGDEIIVGGEVHILWHETGAAAAIAGVQIKPVGTTGLFTAKEFLSAVNPRGHFVFPPTGLVVIENTHNRGGGIVFPHAEAVAICEAADELGIATLLDGARLFNAACVTGLPVSELARPFRMAWVALSKGLGAPAGSVLAGKAEDIAAARRVRRMFGGAMRQIGFLAAAGSYALENNVERLVEDHANARVIAEILSASSAFEINLDTSQTNIVIAHLRIENMDAPTLAKLLREKGVLILPFGPKTIRATTYLGLNQTDCIKAAELLVKETNWHGL